MGRTPTPQRVTTDDDSGLRPLLAEARQIAYRIIGIVEVLEHELGITQERGQEGGAGDA